MTDITTLTPGAGNSPATGADPTPEQAQARMAELRRDSGFQARYAAGDGAARREFAQLNATIAAGMGEHPNDFSLAVSRGAHRQQPQQPAAAPADGGMTAAQAQQRFSELKADKAFLARYNAGDAEARREVKALNAAIAGGMDAEDGTDQPADASGPIDPSSYRMPKLSDDINKPGEIARVQEVDKFLRTTLSSLSVPKESGNALLAAGEQFGTTWAGADTAGRQRIFASEQARLRQAWGDKFEENSKVVNDAILAADAINPGIKHVLLHSGLLNSNTVVNMILQHGLRMRGARA